MFISRGLKAIGAAVVPILIFSQTVMASPTIVTYQNAAGQNVSVDYLNMLSTGGPMRTAFITALTNSENFGYPIYVNDDSGAVIDYAAALNKSELYATALNDSSINHAAAPVANYQMNTDGSVTAVSPSGAATTVASVSAVNGTITVRLSSAPTTTPTAIDFTVKKGTTTVVPTAINTSGTVVTLTVPTIAATTTAQSIVYSVAYQSGTPVTASAFTINAAAFAVSNVSAINASQIQVVYNQAVDKTTATNVTNYSIKYGGSTKPMTPSGNNGATATLSSDATTVTITLLQPLTDPLWGTIKNGDVLQSVISGVKDMALANTLAKTTTNLTYSDTVPPTLVSADAAANTSTNQINLTFSEPIVFTGASVTINGVAATLSAGSTTNIVTVTSVSNLLADTTYDLVLLNFKDTASNLMNPNLVTTTVTVNGDTNAPTVTDVSLVQDSVVEVTFSKAMDITTVNSTNLKVLNSNLDGTGITEGTVIVKPKTTGDTIFQIPLSISLPFNSSGVFTGVLAFSGSLQDTSGNAIVAYSQPLTITQVTDAPQIVSSIYHNVHTYAGLTDNYGFITVEFNMPVTVTPSVLPSVYTLVDNNGGTGNAPSTVVINPYDDTEIVLSLGAAVTSSITNYTVIMPSSAVTDLSLAKNPSAGTSLLVDVSAGAPTTQDVIAPVVALVAANPATTGTSGTSIQVTYTEASSGMDPVSSINTGNYTLNGQFLPAGSYITLSGLVATIKIPAGSIANDGAIYSLNINGVKDKAGNVITPPYVSSALLLADDIKPVMTSAAINTNGTLSIGFSETVIANAAGTPDDLTVKLNGKTLINAGAIKTYATVDGVGADAGKYVLSVNKAIIANALDTYDAVTGKFTDVNGRVWTGNLGNVIKFTFIDANGNHALDAGETILTGVDSGATTAVPFTGNGIYDLNTAKALTLTTAAAPSTIEDTSGLTNPLKGNTTINVK